VIVWVGVALLGGLGAVARALLAEAVTNRPFPRGILVVNVAGSFALGLLVGAGLHGDALLLAGTALLGAFTTFSTWMVDTVRLPRRLAVANVVLSLALGLAAVALGRALG
jgi:CrcB protein